MKKKNLISLSVAFAFLSLSITGLLMYIGKKNHGVETIHVIFGLTFISFAIFHIINNWSSIVSYTKGSGRKIQKEFIIVFVLFIVFVIGAGFDVPPFEPIAEAGKALFRSGPGKERGAGRVSFEGVRTRQESSGKNIQLIIQKNSDVLLPVMAVWVEDSTHQFVENLFVPAKVTTVPEDESDIREAIEEGEIEMKDMSAGALPVWQSKTKSSASNFDKATPLENFILSTKTTASGKYTVLLEIRNGDKTELYQAMIDQSKGKIFSLKSESHSFLVRGIVELD
jgi:hypothetical protein